MAEKKLFISNDGMVTFMCPKCSKIKTINVSQNKNSDKIARIKFKCTCGYTSDVLLERRKFYRKETNLPGTYVLEDNIEKPMVVKDLSLIGLKFDAQSKQNFAVGDEVLVKFSLDNDQEILIRKKVLVKKIFGSFIGAEFCNVEPDDPTDKAIEFYVIP
ncbi:PilZ domain-containing protein [Desulfonema magnum]|uniref:PilZ domain-containing protein n=1 Tax=Desulfonema magnum TaxID=45655 RepID=A0A975BR24_9BACT|nr:PilZ domain-containing protein [Desulfonema magnum]QTA90142.1 PilZ domain-containing protein [Desulfonema magnum]